MDNRYQVEREEYKTFIGQVNKANTHIEESYLQPGQHEVKVVGNISNKILCSRVEDANEEKEYYYVFNYPEGAEYIAPKPVMKINLETRDEVQTFLNALAKLQKEHNNG